LMKNNAARVRAPLQPTIVGEPFEKIAIDISGPFHHSKHSHRYIMAVIDYFSKFLVLIPLRRIDTETIARKLIHHWITIFGVPLRIHTDRGTNFESELFQCMCFLLGIKKTRTSPYYPQSDGLVERVFRTVKPMISAVVKERRISWCETLPIVEMGLRASIQDSIGFSPYEVLFGRKMRLPWMWQYPNDETPHPK
jgi:transposase InsO family protein